MCIHTSVEVDSFNAHYLVLIAVVMGQFDWNLWTVFKVIAKNIRLIFCGDGVFLCTTFTIIIIIIIIIINIVHEVHNKEKKKRDKNRE